jgi:AraC-like DNA-binding protein
MPHVCTIQARAASKIIRAAAEAGVKSEELLRAARLDPVVLEDPENRVPYSQHVALYELGARLTGDDYFGLHVAERADPGMFDILGYLGMVSMTFGEALKRLVRYYRIWSDGAVHDLVVEGQRARLIYTITDASIHECRHECEASLAIPVMLCRRAGGIDWRLEEVRFRHTPPADIAEHKRIFRAPVRFNCPVNELVFTRSYLDLTLIRGDSGLISVLDRQAEDLLARLPKPECFIDKVRRLLKEAPKVDPGLSELARQLGTTERTLQRKLKEEGASYQSLVREVRCALSEQYLRKPEVAISEIAYLLGFSETSAFHRAFRRWTGITPKEYRRLYH